MLDRSFMYIIYKTVGTAVSILFLGKAGAGTEYLLILALVFSCILALDCLINRILTKQTLLQSAIHMLLLLLAFLIDTDRLFPLFAAETAEIIDNETEGANFYYVLSVVLLLAAFIMNPPGDILLFTVLLIVLLLYARSVRSRAESESRIIFDQKEELMKLNHRLADNRRFVNSLKYTAALEERNRLAARLHDKIGHGISGSIILLEASRLMQDRNTEKAKEGLDQAIHNLRKGVDDIREALREERPVRSELGLSELQSALEQFQATHTIKTELTRNGNTDVIGIEIWKCIFDNLEEALTNLLKHSNATEFKLSIRIHNKVIKTEYQDNGKSAEEFSKGLGLEAIEERTIKCGGRCFFEKTEKGFCITNIFTY